MSCLSDGILTDKKRTPIKSKIMAKYKLQEMPSLNSVGEKRVYPKIVTVRQMDTKEFIEKMHSHNRAISESVVTAVLTDVADYLGEMLAMGYAVKLDGLGTFSLSLDFDDDKPVEMASEADRMLYRKVKVKDVNYKSSPELVKCVNLEIELERDMGGVSRLYKRKYTLEERIGRANEWLEIHPFFTLQEYATMNNLSRTTASRELKKLTQGDEAPFGYTGSGSHKVWVRKKE